MNQKHVVQYTESLETSFLSFRDSRVNPITNHGADGNEMNQIPDGTGPVVIDIRQVMNQARLSTESIIQVVEHYEDMLESAKNIAIVYLNGMAAPMLQNLQRDLQSLQRQMVIYAGTVNPDSGLEYHTIQADTVQAITVADVYVSSSGLQTWNTIEFTPPRNGSEPCRNSSEPCYNPT